METVSALQETVAASRGNQDRLMAEVQAEQVLRKDQFRAELDVSRASNGELRKANEELRRDLQRLGKRSMGDEARQLKKGLAFMPFSQAIMDAVITTNFMTPKIVFIGTKDPEAHLTAFDAQMMISGGIDAMQCKLFMGTFIGTSLQ